MMMMSMMKVMMTMMTYIGEDNDNVDCQVPLAMPQRVKREAHDVILDFIRSRPPLKPVRSFYNFLVFVSFKKQGPTKTSEKYFSFGFLRADFFLLLDQCAIKSCLMGHENL